MNNQFIDNQIWRYATKKFDPSKKISNQDLETLKQAIQLSTSSYGLQPYKVFIIENPEIREQLKPFSWNQAQIIDASHLFVFANVIDMQNEHIDSYIDNVIKTRNLKIEDLKGYSDFMKSKIVDLPLETKFNWSAKQTYLALGNLLNAAAELKIDEELALKWLHNGAQPSDTVRNLFSDQGIMEKFHNAKHAK